MTIPQLIEYSTQDILDLFRSAFYEEHGAPMLIGSDDFTASAVFSYVLSVLVNASNTAGAQRFIDSATGVYLDAIAAVNGLERPAAQPSSALFHLIASGSGTIATGALVVGNGSVNFTNNAPIAISGDCDVILYCIEDGSQNNGIAVGALDSIVSGQYISSAQNTTITGGGTDSFPYTADGDNAFREYIKTRRADFVVGGSAPAYKSRCMTVDARLLDVCILQDGDTGYEKGKVKIFTLWDKQTLNNTLEAMLNTKVYDACNATDFRPIGDYIEVASAPEINLNILGNWLLKYRLRDKDVAWQHLQNTMSAYRKYLKSGFRRPFSEGELNRRFCTPSDDGVSALGFDLTMASARWQMPATGSVYDFTWPVLGTIDNYVAAGMVQLIDTEG